MIRSADPKDAPAIASIQVRAWQVAYEGIFPPEYLESLSESQRAEFWHRLISENRNPVLVAEESGAVVGWISGGASRDSDIQGASEVYAVYVLPDQWRRGIGRQLMEAMEERLASLGDVTLWVLDRNQQAIAFYRTLAYEVDDGEKSSQLAGVTISEIRLRKKKPNKAPEPTLGSVTPRAT